MPLWQISHIGLRSPDYKAHQRKNRDTMRNRVRVLRSRYRVRAPALSAVRAESAMVRDC